MSSVPRTRITQILLDAKGAALNEATAARLFEIVYEELRSMAAALMRAERRGHTLQPTALVHEAYVRLVDSSAVPPANRAHFFGIAARAMRQVLVDHARRRNAAKRGGGIERVTLTEDVAGAPDRSLEILELEEVLQRFAALDPRAARVVELRVFAGLSHQETAEALGVSARTAESDWAMGRMWLSRELGRGAP